MKSIVMSILLVTTSVSIFASEHNEVENKKELQCLALNLYYEGRGEMQVGQLAIGLVTIERVKRKEWPDTVCGVVQQARVDSNGQPLRHKCAFSWYCDGKSDNPENIKSWMESMDAAKTLLYGNVVNFMEGATHYHNTSVRPKWATAFKKVGLIGDHIFYVQK